MHKKSNKLMTERERERKKKRERERKEKRTMGEHRQCNVDQQMICD